MHYDIFTTCIVIFFNALQVAGFYLIYMLFFIKNIIPDRRKLLAFSAVSFLILSVGNITGSDFVIDIGALLLPVLTALFLTRNRIYNFLMILPALLLYTLLSVFPEYMLRHVFDNWQDELLGVPRLSVPGMLVDILLLGLLGFSAAKCRKRRISLRLKGWEIGGFCLYFFFALFEIYVLTIFQGTLTNTARIISDSIIFVFTVIIFLAYLRYLFAIRKNQDLESYVKETEDYLSMQLYFLEKEQENHKELRQLRHDLSNHLQIIRELCANRDYAAAEKYAAELSEKSDLSKLLHLTGNRIADIVLSAKREAALSQGTAFICDGDFQCLSYMKPVDVCTLLSNLLDNALEATASIENGCINVQGIRHRNFYTLIVTNPVSKPVSIKNNQVATTKKNKHYHGIGLSGVKRIVQSYHGECMLSCEGNVFSVKVIFPLHNII